MAHIASALTELVGATPLLELKQIERAERLKARLLAKVESFNPGGSIKDRAALSMIVAAERDGSLRPGATIIEPTSGNTGIGLAWVASVKGYRLILTMPETMSLERRKLLQALGATLELTPGAEGMGGAIRRAEELRAATPGAVILDQFSNPANAEAHRLTTGPEILRDTDGEVDMVVAGVGTGGTISGIGAAMRDAGKEVEIVAVEPAASPVLSGGKPSPHRIQGIGAGFVPANFNREVVDRIVTVGDDEAYACARLLAKTEGLLAGISSGAALSAAIGLARLDENAGKTIVVILPDTGDRYLSVADLY